jgi:hypothetical protein
MKQQHMICTLFFLFFLYLFTHSRNPDYKRVSLIEIYQIECEIYQIECEIYQIECEIYHCFKYDIVI